MRLIFKETKMTELWERYEENSVVHCTYTPRIMRLCCRALPPDIIYAPTKGPRQRETVE